MLVTSIFSFSHNVFKSLLFQGHSKSGSCGKELTLSQTSPGFTCLAYKSFKNTVGKGEIARNGQFLLFTQYFSPMKRTCGHFHQILNCRLQTLSIWKSLKFAFRERVNPHYLVPYSSTTLSHILGVFLHILPKLTQLLTHYQTTNFRLFQTEKVCR